MRNVFRTIQWKMVIIFLLLIFFAMQMVSVYLLRSLQDYFLARHIDGQVQISRTLAGLIAEPLSAQDSLAVRQLIRDFGDRNAETIVLDDRGVAVAAADPGLIGQQPFSEVDEVKVALYDARVDSRLFLDADTGVRRMLHAEPVFWQGNVAGAIVTIASLQSIDDTLNQVRIILYTATLLALAVSGFLSMLLARTITGPIQELTVRARKIAAGDFDQQIEIRSGDELGELGLMFNHMASQLQQTLHEISNEKRKAEAVLNYMTDGVLAVDNQKTVLLMNPVAERLLGLNASEMIDRPLSEIARFEEEAPGLSAQIDLVLADGQELATRLEHKTSGRVLNLYLAPIKDAPGSPMGTVVVMHDVTEQEQLENMRKEFVANVSHELRTPLTTIKSYIETLADGAVEDPEVARPFLDTVLSESNRMARLITNLLQLSQIDNQQMKMERKPVNLAALGSDVYARLADRCREKEIELRQDWPSDLPLALGDHDRLEQVFVNLVTNAVDFTPAGGYICTRMRRSGSMIRVEIEDSGVGIPASDLPRIFERFYRVDKTRSRDFGGTGLGLSIARQIVEAHGGSMSIASQVGKGTTVTFTIPIASEAPHDERTEPLEGVS